MGWFRKSTPRDALPVTMAGVKLGDRFLSIGVRDPALIAALATKAGLTGHAAAIDADRARADAGAAAIHADGALVDVTHAPWNALPFADASFDVVLIRDVWSTLAGSTPVECAMEALRVLRGGGRVLVVERAKHARDANAITASLTNAGFAAVRVLAEADRAIFVEAVKTGQ